MNLHNLFYQN